MAARDLQPTVEDHFSDDEPCGPPPEALRKSPTANVAAKRSNNSDLRSEKPAADKVNNIDLQSDSGYSSHTAATMSSADSGISAKASSPSTAPSSAASYPPSSPASTKRRPTLNSDDRKTSQNSPRKPLQRTASTASKRPPPSRRPQQNEGECTNPHCTDCGSNALSSRGRAQRDSGLDIPHLPYDQRSQRSDPAPYTSPPSPTISRQPGPYAHGPAVVQPARTRRASSTTRGRPMSYHEGQQYWTTPGMPAPYPSPPQERGPPPAMSAHYNMQHPQQMPQQMPQFAPPMGMMPPPPSHGYYPQPQPMAQTSPPYEQPRPPLSARGSATNSYTARGRPQSGYGPTAIVTQERKDPPMPSARYHDPQPPRSAKQERFPTFQQSDSEDSEDYSSEEEEEVEEPRRRALMPPPKIKSKSSKGKERPVLRHTQTAQGFLEEPGRRQSFVGMSQSSVLPDRTRERERDPRASRASTTASSRAESRVRPTTLVQQKQKAQSAYADAPPSRSARVVVENPRSHRRQSYYDRTSYEQPSRNVEYVTEPKRRNRDSKIYRDERDERDEPRYYREDKILYPERRHRADTATSIGRRGSYIEQEPPRERNKAMDAEAHIRSTRGTNAPLTDSVHKAAKRASRVPSNPSDNGSNRSDDRKTRVSQSARTTVTNGGGNGEVRIRVDASAPLSLQFNGDMEGRTLQINPAENGMADIVIGNSRGEENSYVSERGSAVGNRKSLVANSARRELEEASVRSSRSSQSRREREPEQRRQPLRRRQTEYN
jgi:hypothetical protein